MRNIKRLLKKAWLFWIGLDAYSFGDRETIAYIEREQAKLEATK